MTQLTEKKGGLRRVGYPISRFGFGDGLTDVPCMKLVKVNGGHSIAVYQDGGKEKVNELLKAERVDFLSQADYSKNSELDLMVRDMIAKMAIADRLHRKSKVQLSGL